MAGSAYVLLAFGSLLCRNNLAVYFVEITIQSDIDCSFSAPTLFSGAMLKISGQLNSPLRIS